MFEKLKNRDIHDPAWLKRQEDQLRMYVRAHPRTPNPSNIPLLQGILILILIGAILFFATRKSPVQHPTPTPTPTVSPLPSSSFTTTPNTTISRTPIPRLTPTRLP